MSAAEVLVVRGGAAPAKARVSPRFLASELKIIFGRRRNLAGLAVLAVVPIILAIAVRVSSPDSEGGGPGFIIGITGNGLFVAFAALILELPIFLPLAVSAIAGDSVAGEANLGTLRYLLTIPAGRTRLLLIKFGAIVIFAFVATLLVSLVGTIMGLALFGGGDMTLLSGTQTSLADGLWRLLLASAYLTVQLSALGAIGLFISTLTEQPIAATDRRLVDQRDDVHPRLDLPARLAASLAAHPLVDRDRRSVARSDRHGRDPARTDHRGGLRRHVLAGRVGAILQQGHHQLIVPVVPVSGAGHIVMSRGRDD